MAQDSESGISFLQSIATYIVTGASLFFILSVFYNYSFFQAIGSQYLSVLSLLDHVSINLSWLLPSVIFLFLTLSAVIIVMRLLSPLSIHKTIPALSAGKRALLGLLITLGLVGIHQFDEYISIVISFSGFFLPALLCAVTTAFGIRTLENAILWYNPKIKDSKIEFITGSLLKLLIVAYALLFLFQVYNKGASDAKAALNPKNAKSHIVFSDAYPCADPQLNQESKGSTTMTGVAVLMNLERGVIVYRPGGGKSSTECDNKSIDKFSLAHFIPWSSIHDIMSVTPLE